MILGGVAGLNEGTCDWLAGGGFTGRQEIWQEDRICFNVRRRFFNVRRKRKT